MTQLDNTLILIDGSSYLFRAYYALPPLTTSEGTPTGAIYGVINMLRKLIKSYDSQRIVVVFDPRGKTVRHEWYPDYKANRGATPEDLSIQIPLLLDAIRAMGLPLVIVEGQEADDVIGTLTKKAQQQGLEVVISTGDKDMAQLVNKDVTLINTMTNKAMDIQGVEDKFGVKPKQMIAYLTLVGDSVDNIPGVNKVGPKTAVKWLTEYHSLQGVIDHADMIKGKVGENLREFLPKIALTQQLVTINCDLPLTTPIDDLTLQEPHIKELNTIFKTLEFTNWLQETSTQQEQQQTDLAYDLILTKEQLAHWLERLQQATHFAFDTETTSLNAINAELVGLSLAFGIGDACYIPLMHDYEGAPAQLDRSYVLAQLQPLLNDTHKTMIGQNLKYDLKVLRNYKFTVKNQLFDTMLASYVLDNARVRHDLDTLALQHLNHNTIKFSDVAGKGAKQLTFNQVSLESAAPYAAEDADIAWQLYRYFEPLLVANPAAYKLLQQVDLPLLRVLVDMEYEGVLLNINKLKRQSAELAKIINNLEEEIFSLAGEEFKLSSPKQLQAILYEKLKLPINKKTPTGQPSTAEPVLQELALHFPLPKLVLEYRSLAKLKSTYTDKLPLEVSPSTGRIHTHYQQTGTSTGRLSSRDPNLQNIPVRSAEGRKIRQAFIANKGYSLISADYSQVELRLVAHMSQDKGLLTAFAQDIDIHTATAAEVFATKLSDVDADQRRQAKAINFGLLYGMSSYGLSKQLGISREDAQNYMNLYFARYPQVAIYMEDIKQQAKEHGYVETMLGRRLHMPNINSSNGMLRKGAERAAINAPLQGTAADIIKLAMIHMQDFIKEGLLDMTMIMQVHDELIFEVADKDIEQATHHIKHYMQDAVKLSVPLLVSIGVGKNWDEAH